MVICGFSDYKTPRNPSSKINIKFCENFVLKNFSISNHFTIFASLLSKGSLGEWLKPPVC